MTIPRPPSSIQDTAIYRKLQLSISDNDGLLAKATRFIDIANPLVDSIAGGPFKSYTLHNRDHARKLLHIAEHIVSKDTLDNLSAFECLLYLYAAYIHDMGLSISGAELIRFVDSGDLAEVLNTWPQLKSNLESLRNRLNIADEKERARIELAISEIHNIAATHHFRPKHATPERYRELLARIRGAAPDVDFFMLRGISFEDELVDICVSHNLGAAVLGELRNAHEERFARRFVVADHTANTQFVAALLRLTDILDFDFERTPKVLFDSLGLKHKSLPGSEVSLEEWQKHLAVQQLEIRETEIVVKARCKHPAVEAAVRQFCGIIEEEIRTTLSVVRRNEQDIVDKYRFRLPSNVRSEIRSDGYKFLDVALTLDESAVMSLLMGTSLYRTPYAAMRELIQNSVDACKVREALSPGLTPTEIAIVHQRDEEGRDWICIRDNGIGMDEYILKAYFFKVGRSYYSSTDFDRLFRTVAAVKPPLASRFGIGFLACFMLADLVEIETLAAPLRQHHDYPPGLRVSIERLGALAYVQEMASKSYGTTVKLRLRQKLGNTDNVHARIFDYVKATVVRPAAAVTVSFPNRTLKIESFDYVTLVDQPRPPEGIPEELFRVVTVNLEKYSDIFSGRVFLIFVSNADGTLLDVHHNDRLLTLEANSVKDRVSIPLHYVFRNFAGNRVTVAGFRMQLSSLGQMLRHGKTVLPAAFDIDVVPGPHVEFDVARTRIIDDNMSLRIRLKEAIRLGLEDLGVWDKLTENLRRALRVRAEGDPFRAKQERLRKRNELILDEELLTKVLLHLPKDSWPVSVHREVAAKLRIPNGMAFRAISTLIVEGRVSNPNIEHCELTANPAVEGTLRDKAAQRPSP